MFDLILNLRLNAYLSYDIIVSNNLYMEDRRNWQVLMGRILNHYTTDSSITEPFGNNGTATQSSTLYRKIWALFLLEFVFNQF